MAKQKKKDVSYADLSPMQKDIYSGEYTSAEIAQRNGKKPHNAYQMKGNMKKRWNIVDVPSGLFNAELSSTEAKGSASSVVSPSLKSLPKKSYKKSAKSQTSSASVAESSDEVTVTYGRVEIILDTKVARRVYITGTGVRVS